MQSDIVQRLQPILRRNGWGNVQEYSRHIPFMLEREGLCIVETSEIARLTEALRKAEEREKALRDDADRYHWLRDHSCPPHNFYISVPDEFAGQRYGPNEVDAYIDAARAALGEPQ